MYGSVAAWQKNAAYLLSLLRNGPKEKGADSAPPAATARQKTRQMAEARRSAAAALLQLGYHHIFGPSIVLFAARESSQGQKTSPF